MCGFMGLESLDRKDCLNLMLRFEYLKSIYMICHLEYIGKCLVDGGSFIFYSNDWKYLYIVLFSALSLSLSFFSPFCLLCF